MIVFIVGYVMMGVALVRLLRRNETVEDVLDDDLGMLLFAVVAWPFVLLVVLASAASVLLNYITRP